MFGNVLHRVLPIFGSLLTAFFTASRQEVETLRRELLSLGEEQLGENLKNLEN